MSNTTTPPQQQTEPTAIVSGSHESGVRSQQPAAIYRTTPARTGKMMAIMLGICIVGGAIFFSMWDYWISEPAPIVAIMAEEANREAEKAAQAARDTVSGNVITQDLSFVESDNLMVLGFNALPDEEGANPTINVSVGDTIKFNVVNDGRSFHSFGVTLGEEGIEGIIPGSEVAAPTNPLKPGESGSAEFIAGQEGTYYYICTVPGHREMGMVGEIIVGPAGSQDGDGATSQAIMAGTGGEAEAPTGVSHNFEMDFVESDNLMVLGFDALPDEEGGNPEIRVNSGDEVTITVTNAGRSFHSFGVVTNPDNPSSTIWNSEIAAPTNPLKAGESGTTTFIAGSPGLYHYICTVPGHNIQGMKGSFIVE